jgi:hypothetical protein
MKSIAIAAALATAALTAPAIALAQAPASAPAGGLSVEKTPISELIKNEKAKAVIEKALPPISQFYDQIGAMTLAQVAPMSQGALDDAKLKEIQAEFDKLK